MQGTVKWFNNSFGFIDGEDQRDYFVHQTAINVEGFRSLDPGMNVEFEAVETEKGWTAQNVEVIDE